MTGYLVVCGNDGVCRCYLESRLSQRCGSAILLLARDVKNAQPAPFEFDNVRRRGDSVAVRMERRKTDSARAVLPYVPPSRRSDHATARRIRSCAVSDLASSTPTPPPERTNEAEKKTRCHSNCPYKDKKTLTANLRRRHRAATLRRGHHADDVLKHHARVELGTVVRAVKRGDPNRPQRRERMGN